MRIPMLAISTLAAALALSACRDHSDITPPPDGTGAAATADDDVALQPDASGLASAYTCDGDHRVQVDGSTARVMLADGRTVELMQAAGTSPSVYAGEALEFTGDASGGTLVQDEVGSFTCTTG